MDIVEQMAADIAMKMNGGEWTDGKWYSQGHRDAWVKTVQPYSDEIERLREALRQITELSPFKFNTGHATLQYITQMLVEMTALAHEALKEKE